MSRQIPHPDNELDGRLRRATEEALIELGLNQVTYDGIRRDQASARRMVDLAEQTNSRIQYHTFTLIPEEPLHDDPSLALTVERLKPYVRREIERLFPQT